VEVSRERGGVSVVVGGVLGWGVGLESGDCGGGENKLSAISACLTLCAMCLI